MTAVLICPSSRPEVERLAATLPLAAVPLLGESLLEYWMTHLALAGVEEVRVLASDRPDQIAALVGNGARWGIKSEVLSEPRELTLAQAQIKFAREITEGSLEITVVDHFPGRSRPLFESYAELFAGTLEWLPHANLPDRIGMRELKPGVWVGAHTRICPGAELRPPCWIGQHVYVGSHSLVGPMAVIEDHCFVESDAEIVNSMVGPDTFVGQSAALEDSLAWGNLLVNWRSNLATHVSDAFLLCSLRSAALGSYTENFLSRLSHLYARNKEDLQAFWKHLHLTTHDKL